VASINRSLTLAAGMVGILAARTASASVVVAKAGGDVHVSDVRLAHATSPARTVSWEQLVLDEARGELAWVIPVPRGGWLEAADDHWFAALDEATAAVIAPHKSLECTAAAREYTAAYRTGVAPRAISSGATLAPSAAIAKLDSLGFVVSASLRAALLRLDAANEDVAILTLPSGARGVTKVVRVLGPAGRPLPMTIMEASGPLPRLTTYTFAEGRAKLASLPTLEVDAAKLQWSGGRSNYGELLDDAVVAAAPGGARPVAGADGVFTEQPAGGAGATIPSLARRYFGAGDECVARVSAMSTSSKLVAPTCAKSSPYAPSATPPGCAVPTSEQMAASQLTCGALDDLAAAAGGLAPSRVVLTRLEGVAAALSVAPALELTALGSVPSFREAKLGPLCTAGGSTTNPPPSGDPSPPPAGTTTPSGDPSGGSQYSSSSSGDGCSSTAQVFADSCSRSSSSSSSSDGCSGDSSSDSDGCSSDSSSSSDGCSGASDSADDGCSSSSGSSSGCSGASSAADDGCRAARARPRIRFSAGVYALIAALAIARRFSRRSGYDRKPRAWTEKTSTDVPVRE